MRQVGVEMAWQRVRATDREEWVCPGSGKVYGDGVCRVYTGCVEPVQFVRKRRNEERI